MDTVNMVRRAGERSGQRPGYHHGSLREALIQAGVELARTGGPNAVQLRAVSRQAGVSHNAGYRHFANQEDLLAAVAERCTTQLGTLMIERSSRVAARGPIRRARARLGAIGRAYIDFARTEPGWFRTAFSPARSHTGAQRDPIPPRAATSGAEQVTSPYLILGDRLDELVDAGVLTPQRRRGAEYAAWAAVHGLSSLLLDGPLRDLPEPEVEYAVTTVLAAIYDGLR